MTLAGSSLLLALAWFAAANVAASIVATAAARIFLRRSRGLSANLLLALRLFPAAIASIFVVAVFLPAHWRFEAPSADESFGLVLYVLAGLAGGLLLSSGWHIVSTLSTCRRLRRACGSAHGTTAREPAVVEVRDLTGVTLAGLARPTILVGAPVRAALTPEELDVALAHELAHWRAWDNVKRFAMSAAPDFFRWTRTARRLEQRWSGEVECLADASAVNGDESRAFHLASALVKVARLEAWTPARDTQVWSTLHARALLELRVRRLVDGTILVGRRRIIAPAGAGCGAAMAIAVTWMFGIPYDLYRLTEQLIRLLP
jgi:hypothetical protein